VEAGEAATDKIAERGLASVDQPHAFGLGKIPHERCFNALEWLPASVPIRLGSFEVDHQFRTLSVPALPSKAVEEGGGKAPVGESSGYLGKARKTAALKPESAAFAPSSSPVANVPII
jgi:hypothetical protein